MKLKGHTDNVRSVILNEDGTEVSKKNKEISFIIFIIFIFFIFFSVSPAVLMVQ